MSLKPLIFIFILASIVACESRPPSIEERTFRAGELEFGPEGEIARGKVSYGCTEQAPPAYTEATRSSLDASLRLKTVEMENIESEFSKNVRSFTAHTSEGTDLNSILFYICQISANRGFTEGTTKSLIEMAILSWSNKSGRSPESLKLELEARQHLLQGYYRMALKEADQLIQIKPQYETAYKLKGHAHFKLGEYLSAVEAFQDALKIDPKFSAAQFGKGAALLELGEYQRAKVVYELLFEQSPSDVMVRFNLALSCLLSGDYMAAESHFIQIYMKEGGYLKAQAAIGLGLSEKFGGSKPESALRWSALFKESICITPQLRGVFEGTTQEVNEEGYALYLNLLNRMRGTPSYQVFLANLKKRNLC